MVAAAVELDAVACNQGESDDTLTGIVLPFPTAFTWNDCPAGVCDAAVPPVKVNVVVESCSTGFVVTTRVTGIDATEVCPESETITVVV